MGQIMNGNRIEALRTAIKERAKKYTHASELILTHNEFIDAFIRPEHIDKLREVQDLTGSIGNRYHHSCTYYQRLDGGETTRHGLLTLNFQGNPPIIIPNYISDGIIPDAPKQIVDKIAAYVEERNRVGHLFGLGTEIITWLATNCKDMRAARTLFPALTLLMKDAFPDPNSSMYRQAEKLLQAPASESLPMMSRMAKNKFIEVSQLIIATTLLPHEVNHPRDMVIIDFDGFNEESLVFSGKRSVYI